MLCRSTSLLLAQLAHYGMLKAAWLLSDLESYIYIPGYIPLFSNFPGRSQPMFRTYTGPLHPKTLSCQKTQSKHTNMATARSQDRP